MQRQTPRWREGDSNPRSRYQGELSCRAMKAEPPEDIVRTSFGEGAAAVQLDLFFAASHSMGLAKRWVWGMSLAAVAALITRPPRKKCRGPARNATCVGRR